MKRPSEGLVVDRRRFISTLAGGLLAAPLAAGAQHAGKTWRIGFLSSSVSPTGLKFLREGFSDLGYAEGRNMVIETRSADLKLERLPDLAVELVRLRVDVIMTSSTPAAQAAKAATATIPIVMVTGGDPVGSGLVASLARPGGNVTGLTHLAGPEMQVKLLELLREVAPKTARLGILTNQSIAPEAHGLALMRAPARALGLTLVTMDVRTPDEFDPAFAAMIRDYVDALFAFESPMNVQNRQRITDFASRRRLPTVFGNPDFVAAGGLMSYGPDFGDLYRRAPSYVDKILKGVKPGDLPVEQPTKFELVINLKTAKALGLTIPSSLLQRADQVIE